MNIYKILPTKLKEAGGFEYCWRQCSSLKTDAERIQFILSLLEKHEISLKVKNEGKSVSKCVEFKEKANKLYISPNCRFFLKSIIATYTESVAHAPPGSQELSIVYANRSAALFTARLYEDCLRDIERALKHNYPDNLKVKLLTRKARCLMALKSPEADEAVEEACEWLEQLELTDSKKKVIKKTLTDSKLLRVDKPRQLLDDRRHFPAIPNDNPDIPGASSAVQVNYSEKYGRHIVATRDIEPGELLVLQRAYAATIDIDKRYIFCGNCMKATWSAIPCDHCVDVIYCSESCREAAWTDHHNIECQVMGPVISFDVSPTIITALRLTVKALKEAESLQTLKEQLQSIDSSADVHTRGFIENPMSKNQYANIYNLQKNLVKYSEGQRLLSFIESAIVLYYLATKTSIFGDNFDDDLTKLSEDKWVKFIGGFILTNWGIAATNARRVLEIGNNSEKGYRGSSIAVFSSLLNHSCCPKTAGWSFGSDYAIYATEFIKKGEQIFDCYMWSYGTTPKLARQEFLQTCHRFTCDCVACTENWPMKEYLPSFLTLPLPTKLKIKMSKRIELFNGYADLVYGGGIDNKPEVITEIIELAKFFGKNINVPCDELYHINAVLESAFAILANRIQKLD